MQVDSPTVIDSVMFFRQNGISAKVGTGSPLILACFGPTHRGRCDRRALLPQHIKAGKHSWLTTFYQEVHGSPYWFLDLNPALGVPQAIWVRPSKNVTPRRDPNSPNLVDYYLYRTRTREQRFPPAQVIHFRCPDPRDPYTG
jgi:hypothetical protein